MNTQTKLQRSLSRGQSAGLHRTGATGMRWGHRILVLLLCFATGTVLSVDVQAQTVTGSKLNITSTDHTLGTFRSSYHWGLVTVENGVEYGAIAQVKADATQVEIGARSSHDLLFSAGNNLPHMMIKTDGKVGIGLLNPTALLDVNGASFMRGNISFQAGTGNGLRFWNNDNYKIHMGNSTEYHYGPVTDYSIKMNMSNHVNRGWVWGVDGQAPVAAINTLGNMKLKGVFEAESSITGAALRVKSKEAGDLHDSGILMEVANGEYNTIRGYDGNTHLGTIHFFDDTWQGGNIYKSGGAINIAGANGVTIGAWNAPSLLVHQNTNTVEVTGTFQLGEMKLANDRTFYLQSNPTYLTKIYDGNYGINFQSRQGNFRFYKGDEGAETLMMHLKTNGDLDIAGAFIGDGSQLTGTQGNFGQFNPHSTYTDFNATVTDWGWNFVQGSANGPNNTSSQWYRYIGSLGSEYGINQYRIEIAYPRFNAATAGVWMRTMENGALKPWVQIAGGAGSTLWTGNGSAISYGGNVTIGAATAKKKLTMHGDIVANRIAVASNPANFTAWPDYVFAQDYDLRSLEEVEAYIKAESHLPEVPSAEEVATEGFDLGDMDATLLKKVEELTLYIIEQNKKLEAQNQQVAEQNAQLLKQNARIEQLEARITDQD